MFLVQVSHSVTRSPKKERVLMCFSLWQPFYLLSNEVQTLVQMVINSL